MRRLMIPICLVSLTGLATVAWGQTALKPREAGAGYRPADPATNPLGLSAVGQRVDRDQIGTFIGNAAAGVEGTIEESELEDILDDFEKKNGVYIQDRDVLVTSGLNSKGLVNALAGSLQKGNIKDGQVQRQRWVPIGAGVRNGRFDERQTLPGLTDSGDTKYYGNGTQKNIGLTNDYRSAVSRSAGNRQTYATSYAERRKQAAGNPYFPAEASMRDLDSRATEFFSNSRPKYDNNGNELHANGKRKYSDDGTPLYSNGRKRVDENGNELHSNGRRRVAEDGRPLYANGRPKVNGSGDELRRDGKRAVAADGRKLHATGKPMETTDGVALHPNGRRKYSGDGLGETPYRPNQPGLPQRTDPGLGNAPFVRKDETRPVTMVTELYSNSRRAATESGQQLYSNGQKRSNDQGDFLYANGRPTANGQNLALNPNGGTVNAQVGFKGRPRGKSTMFEVLSGKLASAKGDQLVIRLDGSKDEVKVQAGSAFVSAGNQKVSSGNLGQLQAAMPIRAIVRSDFHYVDGELIDKDNTSAVALFSASLPQPETETIDGTQKITAETAGRVKTIQNGTTVVLEGVNRQPDESFNVKGAVLQQKTKEGTIPADLRVLRGGSKVRVVYQQDLLYEKGTLKGKGEAKVQAVIIE